MKNIVRDLSILALLILIATIGIVVYFRSANLSKVANSSPRRGAVKTQSVKTQSEGSSSDANGATRWAGLTIYRNGAELKKARRVVVLLHGLRHNAKDFSRIENSFTTDDETCFVYPDAPIKMEFGFAWFQGAQSYEPSREKVVDLLKFIKQENPSVDIVLGGFSQGAMMSSNFLEKDVELLSAIILLAPSGRLRDDITGEAKNKPPVFLAHGRSDRVLPFEGSEQLHEKLVKHEYPVEFVPFDAGHVIPRDILAKVDEFLVRTKPASDQE